jgi:D-amino-acid dehydrogenase
MRIIIIGSGLIGVTSAYFLARHGHAVTVLDRHEAAGMETSYANGGMVTPSQADPWNSPASLAKLISLLLDRDSPLLFRPAALLPLLGWALLFLRNSSPARYRASLRKNAVLANYSLEVFKQIQEDTGIAYDRLQRGTMKVYREAKAFRKARAVSQALTASGVNLEILDPAGVVVQEPALAAGSASISGGVYFPEDESGDAHKFCRALAAEAEKLGAEFRYNAGVTSFRRSRGAIEAVLTDAGELAADCYILAAGSESVGLAGQLGVPVPVRPIKGYSITMDMNGWRQGPGMPVIDDSRHIAITPLGRRLRVAGMAEFAGMDRSIRPDRIAQLQRQLDEIYPEFSHYRDDDSATVWAGLRPYCRDGVPLIGRTAVDNLYLNTGHGHLGWSLSAGSGKLLADYIHAGETDIDIELYRPQRFR